MPTDAVDAGLEGSCTNWRAIPLRLLCLAWPGVQVGPSVDLPIERLANLPDPVAAPAGAA